MPSPIRRPATRSHAPSSLAGRRAAAIGAALALACPTARALTPGPTPAPVAAAQAPTPTPGSAPTALPPPVREQLARAGLDARALAAVVLPVDGGTSRLAWQADVRRPAASLMKLFTTFTALERLGPAWAWRTPVWLDGSLGADGTLQGRVVIQGSGDPSLTVERWWLLLQQVRQRGVRRISGDILLDDRAFPPPAADAPFDGEALKPYNVAPRGLLAALGSVRIDLQPAADGRSARVAVFPALDGVQWPREVPTSGPAVPCGDWQAALGLDLSRPARPQFRGRYPVACGPREWPVAWPDAGDHARRLLAALWREAGGELGGSVRFADEHDAAALAVLAGQEPALRFESPPLAEVVRSINKYSSNPMARALFLTLGQEERAAVSAPSAVLAGSVSPAEGTVPVRPSAPGAPTGPAVPSPAAGTAFVPPGPLAVPSLSSTLAAARQRVAAHARDRAGCLPPDLLLDNGAGLSRVEASSAGCLARLLQAAWASPVMPELLASLPISAVDGTTRRLTGAPGRAHLKTGTLNDVAGVAGYVLGDSGRRWIVVGVLQAPGAPAGRAALDALVTWVADDRDRRP